MRCYKHKKTESIGVCIKCGKGVCESCKVEFKEALHCKDCIKKIGEDNTSKQDKKDPNGVRKSINLEESSKSDKKPEETPDNKNNRRFIAVLMSIFLPGLGLIYLGSVKKGVVAIFIFVMLYALMDSQIKSGAGFPFPVFSLLIFFWLMQVYRTFTVAEKINKGEKVDDSWFYEVLITVLSLAVIMLFVAFLVF